MLVAFKLNNGVDDVLQDFRTCQRAFLCDVSNEDDGHSAGLGKAEQGGGTLTDLGNAACRRLYIFGGNGLYGVDDDEFGLCFFDMLKDGFEGVLSEDEEVFQCVSLASGQSLGTHFQLVGTLLTTDVKYSLLS